MRQDFIFLEGDISLRQAVGAVQERLGSRGVLWSRYYLLVRRGGAYRCVPLASLSAELGPRDWSLDTPLGEFTSFPCAVQAEGAPDRYVREPFVVVEAHGQPVGLEQTRRSPGVLADPAGWWRLVGAYMAASGQVPAWPDPLPEGFRQEPVVHVAPETTLRDLGERLQEILRRYAPQDDRGRYAPQDDRGAPQDDRGEDALLAVQGGRSGEWSLVTVKEFAGRVMNTSPRPAASSQVGALVELSPVTMAALERAETPWELVEEQFRTSPAARFLVTEGGRPATLLSRSRVLRGEPTAKGVTPAGGLGRFLAQLADVEPGREDYGRVVNAWFADQQERAVPYTCALAANRIYHLGVNLGQPDARAHVQGEQPEIVAEVVRYAIARGVPLTLRVDSEDFVVLEREKAVELPRAGTSAEVLFRLATPVQTGLCSLRLGVYFQHNLVQSYRVYARVAPGQEEMPEGTGDGWWSACAYTLSADFTNLKDLSPRQVSIWVGEGEGRPRGRGLGAGEGVQCIGVSGLDLGALPPLNVRFIEGALERYRELLNQGSVRETAQGVVYLYQADHTPNPPGIFDQAIKDLAELGQMLYERVFGEQEGRRVAQGLQAIEQEYGRPLAVQIARLDLDMTFPWAVLYDRPLRYHPGKNRVCQQFANGDRCWDGCPHDGDLNVICPYGFWGFRHIIEQPLRPPNAYASVATRLQVSGRPRVALVYGAGLKRVDPHRRQVDAILGGKADPVVHAATSGLLDEMYGGPALVYLYCHGGNTSYRHWLVVGQDDDLLPAHLDDALRSAWETSGAPLVVLNGCHTGKYDPATLLSFVHRFGALGAAGVIGTEIPIHETMGGFFGEFFLGRFLAGERIGQIVYDFRRELLIKRNVLGLVYVPYCYADLHV